MQNKGLYVELVPLKGIAKVSFDLEHGPNQNQARAYLSETGREVGGQVEVYDPFFGISGAVLIG